MGQLGRERLNRLGAFFFPGGIIKRDDFTD